MAPELEPGDWLVATRPARLRPGVLLVVEHPERPGFELVKRLTALPGDSVGALVLGPGEYWVTGDRSGSSTDSTWFGPVGARHIRGVVHLRYWPPRRLAWLRN
jgi:signal peptidase I